jgi:hypothetical protein
MSKYVQTNFTAADMLGSVKKEEVKVVKPKVTKPVKAEAKPVEVVAEPEVIVEPEVVEEVVPEVTEEVKLEDAE